MDLEESAQVPSLVCIAKLENGVVKLDEEQLKAISPEESNYSVAVVSVIGRTEEQRGIIVKALVECLYTQATDESCPLIANENERNEVDAIFAVFPPGRITNEYGTETAVLILDICCPHYASPAYSKLVNLCLLVSSEVIYTASCNGDKMTSINIEMSELKSVGPSFPSINHVWVIVQDCDSSYCSTPGDAHLLAAEYENLGLSKRTMEEVLLLGRYSDSACRILLAKRSNDAVEECPLQGDSAECSLAWKAMCCKILDISTSIEGVRLGSLMPYFRQHWCPAKAQLALANANHSWKSSYASSVKQSALLAGHRAATYSSRGRGWGIRPLQNEQDQGVSIPPDFSPPCKFDIEELKTADAEPIIMIDLTNEMSGDENEECKHFEQWSGSGFGASTVSKKSSTRDQWMEKDAIPADGCVPELRGTDTKTELAASTLSKASFSKLMNISLEAEDCTVEMGQEPQPMEVDMPCDIVSMYRALMNDYIEKDSSPCFRKMHPVVLEELQLNFGSIQPSDLREIQAIYEEIFKKKMQPEDSYKEIREKTTTPSANSTWNNTTEAHSCDLIVANNAIQYSLERYKFLMGAWVLPHNVYTVKYIKDVHDLVLEAFSFRELTPTFEKAKEKLQEILSTCLHERLEANFAMMRKLDKKEEKLRRLCGMYYKDQMSTKMCEKAVSLEKAKEFHEDTVRDTKQWFRKQCKDVLEPIQDYWEKVLDVKFEFWKTYYMDEFGIKQDLPHVSGFSLSAQNEQPTNTASVGIYFGPDVVQFGLYSSDIETFNQSCVEILPLICFKDEKIVIGDEANNCNTHTYNVFDIISRPTATNQRKSVKLYGKYFILTSNEIAVLFFHEAKKKFESFVKTTQVRTCTVAASGLLTSASKQGLISALIISGFSLVKFIPSTTAILFWYLKLRQGQWYKNTQKDPSVIVIHHTGPLVEVVKAEISAGQHLNIKKIGGFLNYNDFSESPGGKVVISAIHEAISEVKGSSRYLEQPIIIHGSQGDAIIMEHIQNIIGRTFHSGCWQEQSHLHILFSAAAYDADNNGDESVSGYWPRFPIFNHLFPYELSIGTRWENKPMKFPSLGSERHSITLQRSESSFTVCESKKTANMLFYYPCSYSNVKASRSSLNVVYDLTLRDNGTFYISGAPLTCYNFQFISDFDVEYVKKKVTEVIIEKERFMEKSNDSCHTTTPKENAANYLIVLKTSLRNQLEDVKQRLEVSGDSIKSMILEGINDRIKACEQLLNRRDVKEKQLNIAIRQLQVAASRIPSTN